MRQRIRAIGLSIMIILSLCACSTDEGSLYYKLYGDMDVLVAVVITIIGGAILIGLIIFCISLLLCIISVAIMIVVASPVVYLPYRLCIFIKHCICGDKADRYDEMYNLVPSGELEGDKKFLYKSRRSLLQTVVILAVLFIYNLICAKGWPFLFIVFLSILARGVCYFVIHPVKGVRWVKKTWNLYMDWISAIFSAHSSENAGSTSSINNEEGKDNDSSGGFLHIGEILSDMNKSDEETYSRLERDYQQSVQDQYQMDQYNNYQ